MACGCGGNGGSALGNFVVTDGSGKVIRTFTAVTEAEVRLFAAKNTGSTFRKTS